MPRSRFALRFGRVNGEIETHNEGTYYMEWREQGRRWRQPVYSRALVLEQARLKALELESQRKPAEIASLPESPLPGSTGTKLYAVRTASSSSLCRKILTGMSDDSMSLSSGWSFRAAMALAIGADAAQLLFLPLFSEGALSPVDDVLDLVVAAGLVRLLGWHWEFLPAFAVEIVPGLDLVPFWTLAVVNVYRKWKQNSVTEEQARDEARVIEGEYK